jgi:alpha-L-fucosidase
LIRTLAETASKGGNFLLNVGPTELGEFPPAIVERLKAIGAWMWHNSQSIYGTHAGPFERLPWGRCTAKDEPEGTTLYLHVFDWPRDGVLEVPGLLNEVRRAYLLATPAVSLKAEASSAGVRVQVPSKAPDENDTVVALELFGVAAAVPQPIRAGSDGAIVLDAVDADIHGSDARFEADADHRCIGFWSSEKDTVSWDFRVDRPGKFKVEVEWACEEPDAGSMVKVESGEASVPMTVESTGKWTTFQKREIGTLELGVGNAKVHVVPTKKGSGSVMNLRTVRLVPEGNGGR